MNNAIKDSVDLTPAEFKDYRFHTECIRVNLQTIADAADEVIVAVNAVREGKLYRNEYATFEDYVRGEFGKSPSTIYRKLQEVKVLENLATCQQKPGTRQIRELATLPEEEQADAWAESQEKAESEGRETPITKDVKETVQKRKAANGGEYKPPKPDPKPDPKPSLVAPNPKEFHEHYGKLIRFLSSMDNHYQTDAFDMVVDDLDVGLQRYNNLVKEFS